MPKLPVYILSSLLCIVLFGIYSNQSKQSSERPTPDNDPLYLLSKDIGNIIVKKSIFLAKDCDQQTFVKSMASVQSSDTCTHTANRLIRNIPPEVRKEVEDLITQRIYDELKNNRNIMDL